MARITNLFAVCVAFVIFSIANGGVQEATPQILEEALSLYRQYCADGGSEKQTGDGTTVYCKVGVKTRSEESQHEINVTPAPGSAKQIVFVQSPPVKYNHILTLRGGPGDAQQTKIYVLPPKAEHKYEHQDQREAGGQVNKPTLYFLSKQPNQDPSSDVGRGGRIHDVNQPYRNQGPQITEILQPGPTYLPPRNQNFYQPQGAFRG